MRLHVSAIQRIYRGLLVLIFLLLAVGTATGAEVPALQGRVNDYALMLSPDTVSSLEQKLQELEQQDSTQIVVLTINSLQGDSLDGFSMRVVEQWKIGQKDYDNGALLLVSKGDRKIRIEVGYGLEGRLTDLLSGRIIDSIIAPFFKKGDFNAGISAGVDAMIGAVKGEFTAADIPEDKDFGGVVGSIIFAFLFFKNFIGRNPYISALFGGGLLAIVAIIAGAGLILRILLFFIGMILGYLFSRMSGVTTVHSGKSSNLIYHSSGGFGGGFGGFSGGGGGFGGGGASGGW